MHGSPSYASIVHAYLIASTASQVCDHTGAISSGLQAQAHEPLRDVATTLNTAVDALRKELQRRTDAAQPSTQMQVPRQSLTLLRSTVAR